MTPRRPKYIRIYGEQGRNAYYQKDMQPDEIQKELQKLSDIRWVCL